MPQHYGISSRDDRAPSRNALPAMLYNAINKAKAIAPPRRGCWNTSKGKKEDQRRCLSSFPARLQKHMHSRTGGDLGSVSAGQHSPVDPTPTEDDDAQLSHHTDMFDRLGERALRVWNGEKGRGARGDGDERGEIEVAMVSRRGKGGKGGVVRVVGVRTGVVKASSRKGSLKGAGREQVRQSREA